MPLRFIYCIVFSVRNIPQEIQLKIELSNCNTKVYILGQKVIKLEDRNKSLRNLLKYYKRKEKLRKAKKLVNAAAETEKVLLKNLRICYHFAVIAANFIFDNYEAVFRKNNVKSIQNDVFTHKK